MLLEYVATIEKSMNQIATIEKDKDHDANQLVRWVMNGVKRHSHAPNSLQRIAALYFL